MTTDQTIDITVVGVYLIAVTILGLYVGRKKSGSTEDYFLGGRFNKRLNGKGAVVTLFLGMIIGTFCLVFAGIGVIIINDVSGGPITGASMNPARSIAVSLVSGNLQHLWVYLAAPVLGAALAVVGCCCTREAACCASLSEEQASS